MDVSTRAAYGPTSGNYLSTRSLGADFTDGVVGVEGWLSSRSQTPNNSNYAALGLSSVEMTGVGVSDLMLRYLWSTDAIQMWNGVSSTLTSGDAYGTGASSPDYTNADPDNYNQWQHVLLEVDLDANIARAYLDANQATAGGPWTQLGTDQDISGLGITSIGYASILLSRDGNVDDMTTHRGSIIPEPATLSVLALGGLCLLRRRR
jgi:hypothetical protein